MISIQSDFPSFSTSLWSLLDPQNLQLSILWGDCLNFGFQMPLLIASTIGSALATMLGAMISFVLSDCVSLILVLSSLH